MSDTVYLDHNATTPLAAEVREAMEPFHHARFGNASCKHALGQDARKAIEEARAVVADFFGCARDEVVFTGGGTEANNLAIKGAALGRRDRGKHLVISSVEHPSVSLSAKFMESLGFEVTVVPASPTGQITPDAVAAALRKDTQLVSVVHANNEVGTINRLDEIAAVVRGKRIVFHSDAIQSTTKIPTAWPFLGVDLLSVAAHKIYGPKGVGCLIVGRGQKLEPLLHGAGHEKGRRSGTENTAGIVGFAAALKLARRHMVEAGERMVALRDLLHLRLAESLPGVVLNGALLDRLPNTLNVSFLGVSGAELAARLEGVTIATGPACHDRASAPSPTFQAMGLGPDRASSSLRISLGRGTTLADIETVSERLVDAVTALRSGKSLDAAAKKTSEHPRCPRCERPLRLETLRTVAAIVCEQHPRCRYEVALSEPTASSVAD
ncbi:MAG TPA: cysteine desulfurase family protein [Planctomycetota bacterium]|nr:cysteine desulfurase family protein [Planctomycetota bacterium]